MAGLRPSGADGLGLSAGAVVLTTGTFLRGEIHIGEQQTPAGGVGEAPASALAKTRDRLGLSLGRLKTGTPPRIDGRTIDWEALETQPGDEPPEPISGMTGKSRIRRSCVASRCTDRTHAIIRANVHRSSMYSATSRASAHAIAPRSRSKIVRFGEREPPDFPGAGGAR